ncbi:MAG: hypothetical protein ABSE44_18955, partial [Candidatus Sulfotelmatobacter sp.]
MLKLKLSHYRSPEYKSKPRTCANIAGISCGSSHLVLNCDVPNCGEPVSMSTNSATPPSSKVL